MVLRGAGGARASAAVSGAVDGGPENLQVDRTRARRKEVKGNEGRGGGHEKGKFKRLRKQDKRNDLSKRIAWVKKSVMFLTWAMGVTLTMPAWRRRAHLVLEGHVIGDHGGGQMGVHPLAGVEHQRHRGVVVRGHYLLQGEKTGT